MFDFVLLSGVVWEEASHHAGEAGIKMEMAYAWEM